MKKKNPNDTDIKLAEVQCLRCYGKWNLRKPELPIACAKCGSPYWNIPRRRVYERKK